MPKRLDRAVLDAEQETAFLAYSAIAQRLGRAKGAERKRLMEPFYEAQAVYRKAMARYSQARGYDRRHPPKGDTGDKIDVQTVSPRTTDAPPPTCYDEALSEQG